MLAICFCFESFISASKRKMKSLSKKFEFCLHYNFHKHTQITRLFSKRLCVYPYSPFNYVYNYFGHCINITKQSLNNFKKPIVVRKFLYDFSKRPN